MFQASDKISNIKTGLDCAIELSFPDPQLPPQWRYIYILDYLFKCEEQVVKAVVDQIVGCFNDKQDQNDQKMRFHAT